MPKGQHVLIPDPDSGLRLVDRAATSSARIRRFRTLLRLFAELPPVTTAQRQALVEAAISVRVIEDQP